MDIAYLFPLVAVLLLLAALVTLWVAAVVSIARSTFLTVPVKALWIIAVFAFTFVGPIVWFVVSAYGHRDAPAATRAPGA